MLACWLLPLSLAHAQSERWLDPPTGSQYLLGASPAQIGALAQQGQRVFTIERVDGGESYDAVSVTNSDHHAASGTTIVYNRTQAQLSDYLNLNQRRLLDLEVDEDAGTERFSAITVPNAGASAVAASGWLVRRSPAQIGSWLAQNPTLRLVDIEVYDLGGVKHHAALAMTLPAGRATFVLYGATPSEITDELTARQAVLTDIELDSAGGVLSPPRFSVVMTRAPSGAGAWWYPSLSAADVGERIAQHGGRLVALKRWTTSIGAVRYAISILDNANAETRRIRGILDSRPAGGVTGFMLKQSGGEALAALNVDYAFEPASTMKIAHAAAVMQRVARGDNELEEARSYRDPCDPDACPNTHNCATGETRDLGHVLRRMMRRSDNTATRHMSILLDEGGTAYSGVNDFLAAQGLSSASRVRHTIGCFAPTNDVPFNSLTARDIARLYERIGTGVIFHSGWREALFDEHMLNWPQDRSSPNRPWVRLREVLREELDATALTPNERADFEDSFRLAFKPGGYGWDAPAAGYDNVAWLSIAGWARLPHRQEVLGIVASSVRDYSLAMFRDWGAGDLGADQVYDDFIELLRQPLRLAAQSWDAACTPPSVATPGPVTVAEGEDARFSLVTGGSTHGRSFRWQVMRNGTWSTLADAPGAYAGTDSASLSILSATPQQAGVYRASVTNSCGSAATASIQLTVSTAPIGETIFESGFE